MEWNSSWEDPFTSYVKQFDGLIRDQRTRTTFREIVKGIIGAGSLICQQIAAASAELSKGKKGSQRVIRLARAESTKRSTLDAASLTKQLRQVAVEQLAQAPEDELWLLADGSDLRKPSAEAMPYLMQVRALDGQLLPGYRRLNVIGLTPGRRGLLYHRLLRSQAPQFVSEPKEVQAALQTVSQALAPLKKEKTVTWLLDNGFDDVAGWRTSLRTAGAWRLAHLSYPAESGLARSAGAVARGRHCPSESALAPTGPCRNDHGGQGWQASTPQEATGQGQALRLSVAPDLLDQCTSQGARQADHPSRVAARGACARGGLGAVAAADRLAG
jgi:hypothetical protein